MKFKLLAVLFALAALSCSKESEPSIFIENTTWSRDNSEETIHIFIKVFTIESWELDKTDGSECFEHFVADYNFNGNQLQIIDGEDIVVFTVAQTPTTLTLTRNDGDREVISFTKSELNLSILNICASKLNAVKSKVSSWFN